MWLSFDQMWQPHPPLALLWLLRLPNPQKYYLLKADEQSRTSAIRFLNSSDSRKNSYFHYIKKGTAERT